MSKSVIVTSNLEFGQWNRIFGDNRLTSALVVCIMPLLHLREKAIVYAMRCLLETLKLLFKNRVLASALSQLSVFSTCTKQANLKTISM